MCAEQTASFSVEEIKYTVRHSTGSENLLAVKEGVSESE